MWSHRLRNYVHTIPKSSTRKVAPRGRRLRPSDRRRVEVDPQPGTDMEYWLGVNQRDARPIRLGA